MNIPKLCLISLLSAAVCGISGNGGGSSSSAGASPVRVRTVETAAAQTCVTETALTFKNAENAQSRRREQINQPTMTIMLDIKGEIGFHIAGQLDVTIDWGDGSPVETHELEGAGSGVFNDNQYYRHVYSDASSRTITITGVKITYLDCGLSQKPLKSLDVSRNQYLEELSVVNNQLAKLNVNKNGQLSALYLQNNLLPASALNALFGELNAKPIDGTDKYIRITGNPGTYDCRISIAQGKGWKVIDLDGSIVPDNGTLTAPPIMTLTLAPETSEGGCGLTL